MGALEPGDGEEIESEFDDEVAPDALASDDSAGDEEEDDGFGAERELCPDDTCVGVVGVDGTCGECGKVATIGSAPGSPRSKRESTGLGEPVDFMHRSLCPDGSCVGVVGPDGRCKECGKIGEHVLTDPRLRGLKTPAIDDMPPTESSDALQAEGHEQVGEVPKQESAEGGIEVTASPEEFANRRLCPDGSCIGVIGPAGTCKECGAVA